MVSVAQTGRIALESSGRRSAGVRATAIGSCPHDAACARGRVHRVPHARERSCHRTNGTRHRRSTRSRWSYDISPLAQGHTCAFCGSDRDNVHGGAHGHPRADCTHTAAAAGCKPAPGGQRKTSNLWPRPMSVLSIPHRASDVSLSAFVGQEACWVLYRYVPYAGGSDYAHAMEQSSSRSRRTSRPPEREANRAVNVQASVVRART